MSADPIGRQLLLQVILILVNAFFASSEIAVISLNDNKLRRQSEEGDKKAAIMLRMVEQSAGFLSTIQIGITLAGFLGSAFAADNFASRLTTWLVEGCGVTALPAKTLNTLAVVVITLILSYFTLVLGELVPKRMAMQSPEKVARATCSIILWISRAVKPVVWFLSKSTNGVLRLMGIDPNKQEDSVTEEEIRMMVDIGEESGAIESGEREMIENIFEFNNKSAQDVMTHRTDVTALWVEDDPDTIFDTIRKTGLSRFPVYDEDIDDVIGVLSTRDYLINERLKEPRPLRALLREPYFVPETVPSDALFRDMQKKKIHLAIVVDEYGGTSGLVTMEDLLEEIVGNIYDEFDPAVETDIVQLAPNQWRVSGSAELDTLAETLGVTLPLDEEYDTLGGLVFSRFTAIPQDGATPEVTICCTADGDAPEDGAPCARLRIQVEELLEHRVERALVTKLPPEITKGESDHVNKNHPQKD